MPNDAGRVEAAVERDGSTRVIMLGARTSRPQQRAKPAQFRGAKTLRAARPGADEGVRAPSTITSLFNHVEGLTSEMRNEKWKMGNIEALAAHSFAPAF